MYTYPKIGALEDNAKSIEAGLLQYYPVLSSKNSEQTEIITDRQAETI